MIRKFIQNKMIPHTSKEVQDFISRINLSDSARQKFLFILGLMSISYISASIAALISLSYLSDSVTSNVKKGPIAGQLVVAKEPNINYREVRRAVLGRNLFNSKGELPEETDESESKGQGETARPFDLEAPCQAPTVNIKLIGTIAMQPAEQSLATVKDPGYSEVDIYRIGDSIIDHDGVKVAAIDRKSIVLNNNGRKECIKAEEKELKIDITSSSVPAPVSTTALIDMASQNGGSQNMAGNQDSVVIEPAYVAEQLGEGYSKVVNAARLVPSVGDSGQVDGFKIFAIAGDSLLSRIGLQNNDIITQVNNTSLKQPDQGFALYQALEQEREITINILRNGQPQSLRVTIGGRQQ